jgi:hypothetical protein
MAAEMRTYGVIKSQMKKDLCHQRSFGFRKMNELLLHTPAPFLLVDLDMGIVKENE